MRMRGNGPWPLMSPICKPAHPLTPHPPDLSPSARQPFIMLPISLTSHSSCLTTTLKAIYRAQAEATESLSFFCLIVLVSSSLTVLSVTVLVSYSTVYHSYCLSYWLIDRLTVLLFYCTVLQSYCTGLLTVLLSYYCLTTVLHSYTLTVFLFRNLLHVISIRDAICSPLMSSSSLKNQGPPSMIKSK